MYPQVTISSVAYAASCPMRLYLEKGKPYQEHPRYTICKQVSAHLGGPLHPDEIWDEVTTILPTIGIGERPFLLTCIALCREGKWRTPSSHNVACSAPRYGVLGVVDKIYDDSPRFAAMRAHLPPKAGVHWTDRIRLAGYALCLSETLGTEVTEGEVEYIPAGVARRYVIQPRDIRAFFSAREAARRVAAGEIPARPQKSPCHRCPHTSRCERGPSKLSDLL
ncbi:MAG: Dna2/Cas4 domain-containing protein [Methanomicrobiales archaeon]|jgi:CRISPR-associated exonuclease Cas4|nr:Dna2/Cas4 domain-containing protein [Methanomicrobiales archaeon]